MFNNVIIIRYGELYLKGKNKNFFENKLRDNIRSQLSDIPCKLFFGRGRYAVKEYAESDEVTIINRLKHIFGVYSISIAKRCGYDFDEIVATALTLVPQQGSFRVTTQRSYKKYPLNSMQINRELGGRILDVNSNLTVDLHNPDVEIHVDIRESGDVYLYTDNILCAGGMPTGTAGNGLLLLSGGIDSPVAGYMLAKRGINITALHFHSFPYTSIAAKEKVIELAKILKEYTPSITLRSVSLTKIQEAIHANCKDNYMITLVRRAMMRIAERVAKTENCGCIINGESLGQVASQTMESINVTNSVVNVPVFRPLIGMDKNEIIEIANKIGTYETSIEPYEDCCTVFLPDYPLIKPIMDKVIEQENRIDNYSELIETAISEMETIEL